MFEPTLIRSTVCRWRTQRLQSRFLFQFVIFLTTCENDHSNNDTYFLWQFFQPTTTERFAKF